MSSKLNNLSDPLARSLCTFLDPAALGLLASTNKKFHTLALSVETDAGMIQTLVQKHFWRDLGVRDERVYVKDIGQRRWYLQTSDNKAVYQNGLFTSLSLKNRDEYLSSSSSNYFFIRRKEGLEVADLQGKPLCLVPSWFLKAFELPPQNGRPHILILKNEALEIWDIGQKEAPAQILAHPLPGHSCSGGDHAQQFENTLVIYRARVEGRPPVGQQDRMTLFVYDLDHLEKPPQKVSPSQHADFDTDADHSVDRVFLRSNDEDLISCVPTIENRGEQLSWEISKPTNTFYVCANEKWVVLSRNIVHEQDLIATELRVLDAKTGRICGEFPTPFKALSSSSVTLQTTLWGDSILVAWHEDTLHFRSLPEGHALPSYKWEGCKITKVFPCGKQLVVSYKNMTSNECRVISWNTPPCPEEAGAPNELPHMTLIQSERKEEVSLCERIYACVSGIFDWFASLFRWLIT